MRDRLDAGQPPSDATITVADWMARWRETTLAVSDRKESTKMQYGMLSRSHIERPPFGEITLDRLRPSDIEKLILDMRAKTKRGKGDDAEPVRALSDSTIRNTYAVLRTGLDGAVRDGLLGRNPAALVKRPGVERKEARHLDAADVTAILRAAEASRYHTALMLIATTGLRGGEALALRWEHLDLDAGVLKVEAAIGRINGRLVISPPKTQRARRTVPLSPQIVALLREHRTTQLEERMRAANKWIDSGPVFTTALGTPVDPRNLLRVIEAAAKKAGVDGVGVHTLRHSAAFAWLEGGVSTTPKRANLRAAADDLSLPTPDSRVNSELRRSR